MTGPRMNHVEARSSREPARQYVSETHDHKPDAPSKAGHTVGPWFWSHRQIPGDKDGMYATQIYDCGGVTIATAAWYPIKGERYVATNRDANARLIAAAPELLEFAKWVADRGGDNNCMDIFKRARSLIAKAEGGAA